MGGGGGGGKAPRAPLVGGAKRPKKEDLQRQQKLKQMSQQQLQSSDSDSSDASGEICECEFYDYGCRFEGLESVVVVHELTCRFKDAEGMNAFEKLQLKRQVEASLAAGPEDLPKDVQDDLNRVDSEIKQINFDQVRCNRDSVCGDNC